ncbi:O-antigen ligase family protein [Chlorogloeopsis fritschii PCC 9212]|uniref:O-antigen polymerase n=1 Tax=Chlorogloeopsis fritschii PCC 6912 TaxID=211165 RepID=A0A3S1FVP7_CHLFR|nr:hypothetical protein [Chlorogloeopsis fritschii]MBF2006461.1 O-antigen ligase domain-containing protein [Chlorogloeopsis fritschii C42_A2020_084]RUR86814.1 hypothetical protein PCC6912_02570 [Chlorogloeopsis fritschii PCC 6912]
MKPNNFPEKVIWYSIIGTYIFYFTGLLYFVAAFVGWVLTFYLLKKWWEQTERTPIDQRINVPWLVWVWIVCMLAMEVALIIGHIDFNLGMATMIKSTLGWVRGWALWALLPLIACLNVRPQLVSRAVCVLCLQTLILFPFYFSAYLLHIPTPWYTVPLNVFGGPPAAFTIAPYLFEAETGTFRIGFFAPWAAAIGFVGAVYFPLCMYEKDKRWRWIGMAASFLMCLVSGSRLAVLSVFIAWLIPEVIANLHRPFLLFIASGLSVVTGIFYQNILDSIEFLYGGFRNLRKSSSEVRENLDRIAIYRWSDAPITGHGTTEPGPHLVQFMPIGTHNNWTSLLFLKGIVGFFALAIPMVFSFIDLAVKAQKSLVAKIALRIFVAIFLNTFADTIEVSVYLIWPAVVFMGMGFQEQQSKTKNTYSYSNAMS